MVIRNFGLTIFTPTYNRANTLEKLYNSLLVQENKKFEWLIVDDGSTDNTKEIVENWIKQEKIKIRYIFQENQGKSSAHNIGVLNANYNLFMCVDSDDYISQDAVKKLNEVNKKIIDKDDIVGIISYKHNINNVEKAIKHLNIEYTTVSKLYRRYHYKDEIALVYKTDILRKNLFPIIDREKFIPEAYLYDRIDNIGNLYLLQHIIYYYEYMLDGYTNNSANLLKNNINGYILYSKQRMEISQIFENRIKGAIQYNIANLIAKKNWRYMCNKFFVLLIITFVPSYIYYLKKYKLSR